MNLNKVSKISKAKQIDDDKESSKSNKFFTKRVNKYQSAERRKRDEVESQSSMPDINQSPNLQNQKRMHLKTNSSDL